MSVREIGIDCPSDGFLKPEIIRAARIVPILLARPLPYPLESPKFSPKNNRRGLNHVQIHGAQFANQWPVGLVYRAGLRRTSRMRILFHHSFLRSGDDREKMEARDEQSQGECPCPGAEGRRGLPTNRWEFSSPGFHVGMFWSDQRNVISRLGWGAV